MEMKKTSVSTFGQPRPTKSLQYHFIDRRSLLLGALLVLVTFKWNFVAVGSAPNTFFIFPGMFIPVCWWLWKRLGRPRTARLRKSLGFAAGWLVSVSLALSFLVASLPLRALTIVPVALAAASLYWVVKNSSLGIYRGLYALSIAGACHALFQIGHAAGIFPQLGQLEVGTASGLTWYYLQAAHFAAMGLIASTFIAVSRDQNRPTRLYGSLSGLVCLFAIWTQGSRFYAVASVVSVVAVCIWVRGIRFAALTAALGAGLFLLWTSRLSNLRSVTRLLSDGFTSSDSFGEYRRGVIQSLAWDIVGSHPLGVGWGGFTAFTSGTLFEQISSSHNMYSGILLDFGWLAGPIIIVSFTVAAFHTLRVKAMVSKPISLMWLLLIVSGFLDTMLIYPPEFLFLAFLFALTSQLSQGRHNEDI